MTAKLLSPDDIATICQSALGDNWRAQLGAALGLERQSGYKLASAPVSGTQAAAIVGLLARQLAREQADEAQRREEVDARQSGLAALLAHYEARLG